MSAGGHLRDYWPAYGDGLPSEGMRPRNFCNLIGDAGHQQTSLSKCVSDVGRALYFEMWMHCCLRSSVTGAP